MKHDDSDWIKRHFAAVSHELTPAPTGSTVSVLYAPLSPDSEVSRRCASVLSDTEVQRAQRLATDDDRSRFIQRRAFRRFCGASALGMSGPLSQIDFKETDKGRPYLPDFPRIWFSFSSCRFGLLGAWSSTCGIGVDLEDRTGNIEAADLARCYFLQTETDAVQGLYGAERLRTFFQYWSLKEAALKSIGEGLPFGLDAFEFALHPRLDILHAPPDRGGPEQFDAHIVEAHGICGAVVLHNLA
jgi:4'-phosphopantetheinyl transferase